MDDSELRSFIQDDYPRLVGAVALVTGSLPTAEDAVQEACVRAWERLDRGESIERLGAWIATVSLNLSRSALRRVVSERRARARFGLPRPVPAPSTDTIDVKRALSVLPRRQREAIVLRYFLDFTPAEVAQTMHTSEGTVKSQLAKARSHLADALALRDEPNQEANHAER